MSFTEKKDFHTEMQRPYFSHKNSMYDCHSSSFGDQNGNRHSISLARESNTKSAAENSYIHQRPRIRNDSLLTGAIPLSCVRPGCVRPSEAQLDLAFAYGIRRSDGRITRLIRADYLNTPYLNPQIPQSQTEEEGLIILPEPRQPSPDHRRGQDPLVPQQKIRELNNSVIIETYNAHKRNSNQTQLQIDAILNTGPNNRATKPNLHNRQKVYCDKWVHEGVCAFTQIGCKFKHEMPSDKATQISLGLNHGYPKWYRRAYAQSLSPCSAPSICKSSERSQQKSFEQNWRRQSETGSNNVSLTQEVSMLGSQPNFGPIGPPPSHWTFRTDHYPFIQGDYANPEREYSE